MNIFVLDSNPRVIPSLMHDKHVVKMVLETAQLLSNQHHKYNSPYKDTVYKPTHMSHPCSVWTGESSHNYDWLFTHFQALLAEYTHRYYREHKCFEIFGVLRLNPVPPHPIYSEKVRALQPQCMPDKYKRKDVVEAYRAYYRGEKLTYSSRGRQHKNTWTNRHKPTWME